MALVYESKRKGHQLAKPKNKLNVVASISGGIDSSTLLYYLKAQPVIGVVKAITFNYGQKLEREIKAALEISSCLGVDCKVIDISNIQSLLTKSALIGKDVEIPEVPETAEHYETLKVTIVPNRNTIFLSLAVAYAVNLDYDAVAYAAHWSDKGVYPDCTVEFVEAFEKAMQIGNDRPIKIIAPFLRINKTEIVRRGHKLGVPYLLTWSCYKGGKVHCGVCSSCRERKGAFKETNIPDPTLYEE